MLRKLSKIEVVAPKEEEEYMHLTYVNFVGIKRSVYKATFDKYQASVICTDFAIPAGNFR
jgi:hypothetical protein